MTGVYKQSSIPVLQFDGVEAVNNKEKASMLVKQFQKINRSENVSEGNRRRREEILDKHQNKLQTNWDNSEAINLFFSLD